MTIEEFQRAELRVGKIISAERVAGSDKLLKLQVDLGPETRQILSGIGKVYAPEDLQDREVVLVANLEPREIMGMMSQGMVLAAHGADGRPVVLAPMQEVPPGSAVS